MAKNSNRSRFWSVSSVLSLVSTNSVNKNNENVNSCGFLGFYPQNLQKLATPRFFLVCFCLKNILQGMIFTYLVGIETSLERHFQFDGKAIGLLLTLGELGPILTAFLISYFGGKGNRPRWMSFGLLLISLSLLLGFFMNSVFPPPKISSFGKENLCQRNEILSSGVNGTSPHAECTIDASRKQAAFSAWVVIYSLMGIGGTTVYTIGAPYLDDSISKKDSAWYFGISVAVRIFGPVLGYLLSSAVLHLNVQLGHDPGYSSSDPRWIGAWWLGFVIIAVLTFLFSFVMAAFPQKLPSQVDNKNEENQSSVNDDETKSKRGFKHSVRRLFRNRILMYSCGSSIFTVLGLAGFFIWLPKFFEHEFRLTKSRASMYSGISGNATMIFGVLLSSYLMKRYRPSGRIVALSVAVSKYVYAGGLIVLMFCSCGFQNDLPGTLQDDGSLSLDSRCNSDCGCTTSEFVPVCYRSNNNFTNNSSSSSFQKTFFSPCYAGCTAASANNSNYFNCRCTDPGATYSSSVVVSPGYCDTTCWVLYVYMFLLAVIKFVVSTSTIGNLIIDLRCVEPQDKALALGLLAAVSGLLGFLPNPIIYGTLIDSSCLVWEESCGQRGSCWVYDTDSFRYKLHGLTAGLLIVAGIFETLTFVEAKNLNLNDPEEPDLPLSN